VLRNAIIAGFAACLFAGSAFGDITVEITKGGVARTPVAVVPFGWSGQSADMPLDIAEVIAADLRRSGRFEPIAEENMLQKPTTGAELDFDDWSFVKAEAVVVGRVVQTGENAYDVSFQLFDVFRQEQLVGYRIPASRGTMRIVAHRAADMIYEKLTGIKGVFATKVAFITAERNQQAQTYRLVVADQDGFNETVVMQSKDPIMSPAWSPDGGRLAYVSFEGGQTGIFIQELASGKRERITSFPGINGAPTWSPDGPYSETRIVRRSDAMRIDTTPPGGASRIFSEAPASRSHRSRPLRPAV